MCPKYIQSFVSISKIIITLIKVAVPILLIVFGSIDMFKAVTQQNEDEIKKATKKFIERLIAAAIVFFVFPIIIFIANVVAPNSKYVTDFTYCYEHETAWNTDGTGDTVIEKPSNQVEDDINENNYNNTQSASVISTSITEESFTGSTSTLKYMLYIPTFDRDIDDLTLLVFLHGASERGNNLNTIKNSPPFGQMEEYKAIIIAPQCPSDKTWSTSSIKKTVIELIEYIKEQYGVNPKKIAIAGFSMGAYGAYKYVDNYPKLFSSLVITSIKSLNISTAVNYTNLPVRAYYGGNEDAGNIKSIKSFIAVINAYGGNASFEVISDKSHGQMDDYVYYETDTIEWMIKQTNQKSDLQ